MNERATGREWRGVRRLFPHSLFRIYLWRIGVTLGVVFGALGCSADGGDDAPPSLSFGDAGSSDACSGDECTETPSCRSGTWLSDDGQCVQCLHDAHCATGLCHPTRLQCVACYLDKHCGSGVCDAERSFCVECLADADCNSGQCDTALNVCEGCGADADCDDGNPCTTDRCDDRLCTSTAVSDGTSCEDGDACTSGDQCVAGSCAPGDGLDQKCAFCDASTPCDAGYVCQTEPGLCAGAGTCTPQPTACENVIAPVCGCDGETWNNVCEARRAGVAVAGSGECQCSGEVTTCDGVLVPVDTNKDGCQDACGCPAAPECPAAQPVDSNNDGCADTCSCKADTGCSADGQVCQVTSCGAKGYCAPAQTECPTDEAVCGCDGEDYGSRCDAEAKGVSVSHVGVCCEPPVCPGGTLVDIDEDGCADVCECEKTDQCESGAYCAISECGKTGVCTVCDEAVAMDPVCGCDGKTWDSVCEAPTGVLHDGACCGAFDCLVGDPIDTTGDGCPDTCTCVDQCGNGEVCAPKSCSSNVTVCRPCLEDTGPVCGCDGATWASACEAFKNGVSVLHAGACKCSTQKPCAAGQVCDVASCGASVVGTCQPCSDAAAPACGCDGNEYSDTCALAEAGIALKTVGTCEESCVSITCDSDQVGKDTTLDGCIDTCECNPPTCGSDQQAVDTNGNQCIDACKCAPVVCEPWQTVDGTSASGCDECQAKVCETSADCGFDVGTGVGDAWCKRADGACDGVGTCEPFTNLSCPADAPPVCDCNGESWESACEAIKAGAIVASEGKCACPDLGFECKAGFELADSDNDGCPDKCVAKACESTDECGSADVYCAFPKGSCGGVGTCTAVTTSCPDAGVAVCGCDSKTYPSECVAQAAGVSVAKVGACACADGVDTTSCGDACIATTQCAANEYCAFAEEVCGGEGVCTPVPTSCVGAAAESVCGCDGKKYESQCLAAQSSMNVGKADACQ